MSGHTPGPWYVVDLRASQMRAQGWDGPSIDRILVTNAPSAKLTESGGADCVVARVQFDQRTEELGENNLADARLIAASPDLLRLVREFRQQCWGDWHSNMSQEQFDTDPTITDIDAVLARVSP